MSRSLAVSLGLVVALVAMAGATYVWLSDRRPPPVTGHDVTYICLETHEVLDGPVQPVPAINPHTGRRTLVRAIYSNRTQEWIPAPSEEVLRRNRQALSENSADAPLAFEAPDEEEDTDETMPAQESADAK
ncbi:MAG: hypothetical protein JSS02_03195 [Planctomycetes bacterium]|nr:hypothetical protein [Planctomycetota bacterium]